MMGHKRLFFLFLLASFLMMSCDVDSTFQRSSIRHSEENSLLRQVLVSDSQPVTTGRLGNASSSAQGRWNVEIVPNVDPDSIRLNLASHILRLKEAKNSVSVRPDSLAFRQYFRLASDVIQGRPRGVSHWAAQRITDEPFDAAKICLKVVTALGLYYRAHQQEVELNTPLKDKLKAEALAEMMAISRKTSFPYGEKINEYLNGEKEVRDIVSSLYVLGGPIATSCLAHGYDWMKPLFDESEKAHLLSKIEQFISISTLMAPVLLGEPGNKANTNLGANLVGNIGLSSLAILESVSFSCRNPETPAQRGLCMAVEYAPRFYEHISEQGAYFEGGTYYALAMEPLTAFGSAAKDLLNTGFGFFGLEKNKKMAKLFAYTISPSSSFQVGASDLLSSQIGVLRDNFSDSLLLDHSNFDRALPTIGVLYRFANSDNDRGGIRSIADQVLAVHTSNEYYLKWSASNAGEWNFLAPLFYGAGRTRSQPDKSLLLNSPDNFEFALMRRENSDQSYLRLMGGTSFAVKHKHLDNGSLVFDAFGVRWISDLGRNYYPLNNNFSYLENPLEFAVKSNRWQYLRNNHLGHSGPVIGRHWPKPNASSILSDFVTGGGWQSSAGECGLDFALLAP